MRTLYNYTIVIACLLLPVYSCYAQGLYNSANVIISGDAFINVQDGGFYSNGVFAPATGTVILGGTAATATSTIAVNNSSAFYHLTINKISNDVVLWDNIKVDGNLSMQQGNLLLNGFTIDLGIGAGTIVNEHNNGSITGVNGGYISKTASLNAPVAVNPGNLGMVISSTANLGSTVIRRGHQQQTVTGKLLSINRYYDIIPTNNVSLQASLQMYYQDNELAGTSKNALTFYRSEDNGASFFLAGNDKSDQAANWVLKNNIDKLSRWTLAASSALPVKLLSFSAKVINQQTSLQWVTAQEINSSFFEVQRSTDGLTFNRLLRIPAQGNSNLPTTYHATDSNPFNGINYYRLLETDLDGKTNLSAVVAVRVNTGASWSVYPNPVSANFHVNIILPAAKQIVINLFDANGKSVEQKLVNLATGTNQVQWNISRLPTGNYFLKTTGNDMPVIKVVKQ